MKGDEEFVIPDAAEEVTTTFPEADPIVGVGGPEGAVKGRDPWLGIGGVNRLKGWPIVDDVEGAVAAVNLGLNGLKGWGWLNGLMILSAVVTEPTLLVEHDDGDTVVSAGDFEIEFPLEVPCIVGNEEELIPTKPISLLSALDGDVLPSIFERFFSSVERDLTWDPFTVDGIELTSEATIAREDVNPSFEPGGDGAEDIDCCFSDAINSLDADDPLLFMLDSTSINDSVPESWPLSWLRLVDSFVPSVDSFLMSDSLKNSTIKDPFVSELLFPWSLMILVVLLLLVAGDLLLAAELRSFVLMLFGTLESSFFIVFLDLGPGDRRFLLTTFEPSSKECSSSVDEEDETEDEFLDDSPEDNEWLLLLFLLLSGESVATVLGEDDELEDDLWDDFDEFFFTADESISQEFVDIGRLIRAGLLCKFWHFAVLLLPLPDLTTNDSPSDSCNGNQTQSIRKSKDE